MGTGNEVIASAVKLTPAVGGTAYSWLTLSEVAALSTIAYTLVMVGVALHKHYHWVRKQ